MSIATEPLSSAAPEYRRKLDALRQAEVVRRKRTGWRLAALVCLSLLTPLVVLDYFWPLAWTYRAAGLSVAVIGAALVIRETLRRSRYQAHDAAAAVETAFPDYGQRLRTVLDYEEHPKSVSPASPMMVESLRTDANRLAAKDDFREVSSPVWLRLTSIALAAAVMAVLFCLAINPELRIASARAFLFPAHYTEVTAAPIDSPVPRGQDVVVRANVSGRPLNEATVRYRPAEGKQPWQSLELTKVGGDPIDGLHGNLEATLENCKESLEILVIAGPKAHPVQRLIVLQPLELKSFAAEITPPSYLNRPSQVVEEDSFSVYEGSTVRLRFEMSRPPDKAHLDMQYLAATDAAPPVELTLSGGAVEAVLLDVRRSMRFTLSARAADGVAFESSRYRMRVKVDKKPSIRFVSPEEELEVIPTTEVPLAVDASDDIGVTKVGVAAKVGDGPMTTLWEQTFEGEGAAQGRPVLYLEEHDVAFPDAVTYYAFAEDDYFDQPRRVTTPLRFIDIRPFKREYQILNQPGGT